MPFNSRHFHAWQDVERIAMALLVGPQAGIQHIVIGDGDHVEMPAASDMLQYLCGGRQAIAGASVQVQVSASSEQLIIHGGFIPVE